MESKSLVSDRYPTGIDFYKKPKMFSDQSQNYAVSFDFTRINITMAFHWYSYDSDGSFGRKREEIMIRLWQQPKI